jgi:hypothetical protein
MSETITAKLIYITPPTTTVNDKELLKVGRQILSSVGLAKLPFEGVGYHFDGTTAVIKGLDPENQDILHTIEKIVDTLNGRLTSKDSKKKYDWTVDEEPVQVTPGPVVQETTPINQPTPVETPTLITETRIVTECSSCDQNETLALDALRTLDKGVEGAVTQERNKIVKLQNKLQQLCSNYHTP